MAQAAESTREPAPQTTRAPPTPAPTREPAPEPLPPLNVPVDLALVGTRSPSPAEQAIDGPLASLETALRSTHASEDSGTLSARAERLAARLGESEVGPLLGRELAVSLLQIRQLLLARGEPLTSPIYAGVARWQARADAPTTVDATRNSNPPRSSRSPAAAPPAAVREPDSGPGRVTADPLVLPIPRGDGPRDRARDELRAGLESLTRGGLAVFDDGELLTRARALDASLGERTTGPKQARARRETITYIGGVLRERGAAQADDPVFTRDGALPELARPPGEPARPRRPRTPRPQLRAPALPEGAIRLDDEVVSPGLLLRHAASILSGRGFPTTRVNLRGRPADVLTNLADPDATRALAPLREAADGVAAGSRKALTAGQRIAALKAGRALIEARSEYVPIDEVAARLDFEAAYEIQYDGLLGLRAAEPLGNGLGADDPRRGLAEPRLADIQLLANIDGLMLALDSVSKLVTGVTRFQAPAFAPLAKQATDQLAAAGILASNFPRGEFGLIGAFAYLRAALNATKTALNAGNISSNGNILEQANILPKLAEGLLGGLAFTIQSAALLSRQPELAATTLVKYFPVGRNLVWTSAFIQLLNGAIHLGTVALGDAKFKRAFLTDTLYGGAGTVAPVVYAAGKLTDLGIQRATQRLVTSQLESVDLFLAPAELAQPLALEAAQYGEGLALQRVASLAARRALVTRIGLAAAPFTFYLALADITLAAGAYAVAESERIGASTNLELGLGTLQYIGGGISQQALDLQTTVETPALAPTLAPRRARSLYTYMVGQIADLRRYHRDPNNRGSVPALARRLAAAEDRLDNVRPDDPASVTKAARGVLAEIRRIFAATRELYLEELKRLDEAAVLFRSHEDVLDPPKP